MEKCGTPMEQKIHLMPWKHQDLSDTACDQKEQDSSYFNVRRYDDQAILNFAIINEDLYSFCYFLFKTNIFKIIQECNIAFLRS